jgi:serine/threonine protein kinase
LFLSGRKLNNEQKLELIQGIARGVPHLHKHNVVHRDLAARNILLTSGGDPKISVFFLFVFLLHSIYLFQFLSICEHLIVL